MTTELRDEIASSFAELTDPRQPINRSHLFIDILVISICAIVCGADDWEAVGHVALSLLRQEKTCKLGVKNKRLKAGWDDDYLIRVVQPLFS